jgi:hypothetical protein
MTDIVEIIKSVSVKVTESYLARVGAVSGTGTGTVTIQYETGESEVITDYAV